MKVITIGTGMAAAEFVERLRLEGYRGDVVMFSDEEYAPYSPCVIPFFLAGEPLETVFWKGMDFYERCRVVPRLGEAVTDVDVERRTVRTAKGRTESYDRLFFATGARSWYPEPAWLDTQGVFGFKTLTDMVAIDRYIRKHDVRSAVVFGGGFIGTDAALALRHRGLQVVLVHRNNRILSQMTDMEGGQFATRRLGEKTGIDIRLRTIVEGIEAEGGRLKSVALTGGEEIETALLIIAIGVSPNAESIRGDDRGILANDQMLACPNVYVAGDVAETRHALTGKPGIYATWPNAMRQARTAARHLVHGDGSYPGSINSNVLRKHVDFPVISAGTFEGETVTWQNDRLFRRVYLRDGRIHGYVLVGDTRLSGYIYELYTSRAVVEKRIGRILSDTRGDSYFRGMMGLESAASPPSAPEQ